jgi:hypothetical protein
LNASIIASACCAQGSANTPDMFEKAEPRDRKASRNSGVS